METKLQFTVETNPLFLLHKLDKLGTGTDTTPKIELRVILDARGHV